MNDILMMALIVTTAVSVVVTWKPCGVVEEAK